MSDASRALRRAITSLHETSQSKQVYKFYQDDLLQAFLFLALTLKDIAENILLNFRRGN